MRYDGRIVFKHPDGSVELYGPGSPVRGEYRHNDETLSVEALGNGLTELSAVSIQKLDTWVAEGKATFTPSETEAEYWQRIHDRTKAAVPHLADAEWVATIPSAEHLGKDRYFRGAWTWTTPEPVIDVDMGKAAEIHKSELRKLREPKFAPLEQVQRTALAEGDLVEAIRIEEKLQTLRDVTVDPRIAAAKTPEELKVVIPEALK